MSALTSTRVRRSGRTARSWSDATESVDLRARPGALELGFTIPSKGGGLTDIEVTLGYPDFLVIAEAMVAADRTRALVGMSEVIRREMERQQDLERAAIRRGRESVTAAAREAYLDADSDHDHVERMILKAVQRLVEKCEEGEAVEGGGSG
ncbi:MAG TPA: hypothetical protein VMF30_01060 [Pirellulales bacterium]|nr:hypothetical protein [Pirellulales bacterium]